MSILSVKNLNFSYENEGLYKNLSFDLNLGEHATLVGPNGCGKSTFMKIIINKLSPDSGTVKWLNGVKYSYLDQQLEVDTDVIIYDYLYGVYKGLFDEEKKLNDLYSSLSTEEDPNKQESILERAESIRLNLEMNNFYDIETKVNNVIVGLGLKSIDLSRMLSTLSGGEKAKVYLAKILLEEPTCILMDEPTNFLDKNHIEWLENFLNNYQGTFLIISHDQDFLKAISRVVYAIENKVLNRYKGDYDYYLRERVVRFDQQLKNYNNQQKLIKRTKIFIEKNIVRASTTKMAQSRRKFLERLDVIEKPQSEQTIKIHFPFSKNLGEKVLDIEDLEIGYNNEPLLEPFSYHLRRGERVEIIGRNGVGKTTLIKTLLEKIDKISGEFKFGDAVDINYFSQEEDIDKSINAIDYVRLTYPDMTINEVMKVVSPLGINMDLARKPISELSGGELERVRLSLLTRKKSNLLILDEPTNHLDKNTKIALHDAIEEFPGSLIIVSHEKGFADDLVDYIVKF
ncbi:MAG: ATP-binding cassette domain-containing protein [Gammaproteobacteria bacterium]|nr:ATP-binding cassette domain-containing protein [Gammaproteobacteria bacterium]